MEALFWVIMVVNSMIALKLLDNLVWGVRRIANALERIAGKEGDRK